jgi:hypothetical protein
VEAAIEASEPCILPVERPVAETDRIAAWPPRAREFEQVSATGAVVELRLPARPYCCLLWRHAAPPVSPEPSVLTVAKASRVTAATCRQ